MRVQAPVGWQVLGIFCKFEVRLVNEPHLNFTLLKQLARDGTSIGNRDMLQAKQFSPSSCLSTTIFLNRASIYLLSSHRFKRIILS